MSFGDNLKYWMDRKGLNAYELSEMTEVPVQTIYSMIKRNSKRADVDYIIRIAKALGVTVDELLGNEEDPYYLNPESAALAQEAFENPDLRLLFSAARNIEPEALKSVIEMVKHMKQKENPHLEDWPDEEFPDDHNQDTWDE